MNAVPKVIFLAGVSGSGKTTMMSLLLQDSRFEKVCSVTTRKPREGEINGDQYIFMNTGEFEYLIDYDGWGYLATSNKESFIRISPSQVDSFNFPDWSTHIVWYNR